jgi:hypothetical protein
MPYNGAHMYPVETAEYLVDAGVVTDENITHGIVASRHIDPVDLEHAWTTIADALAFVDNLSPLKKWSKAVYLTHIGLMGIPTQSTTTVVNTRLPEDVPAASLIYQHRKGQMRLAYETHILDNRTWFPLSLIALYGEQTAMAIAWRMIRAEERALRKPLICAWHVDGIAVTKVSKRLLREVEKPTYPNGKPMFQLEEKQYKNLPRRAHEEISFQVHREQELPRIRCMSHFDEQSLTDELKASCSDHDWFEKLARKLFDNAGGMVTGPGGVGKTHLLRTFKNLVESEGQVCHVIALTHVASRLARGKTIARFLTRQTMYMTDRTWIVVDEASQIPQH